MCVLNYIIYFLGHITEEFMTKPFMLDFKAVPFSAHERAPKGSLTNMTFREF